MMFLLAQTDVTIRTLLNGPALGVVIFGAGMAVFSLALWWACVQQLQHPIAKRSLLFVFALYVSLYISVVMLMAYLFTITGLDFTFTLITSFVLGTIVSVPIWQQFIYKGLTLLPGPGEKPPRG